MGLGSFGFELMGGLGFVVIARTSNFAEILFPAPGWRVAVIRQPLAMRKVPQLHF